MTKKAQTVSCLLLLFLASCVNNPNTGRDPRISDADFQQIKDECDYDAEKATVSISDPMEAGWQKGSLKGKCIRLKQNAILNKAIK